MTTFNLNLKATLASAFLATILFAPTSASANYYGYQRCMNNGGNWFTCLGELADTMVVGPELEKELSPLRSQGEERIQAKIKALSSTCDAQKGQEQSACYIRGLKANLTTKEVVSEKAVVGKSVKKGIAVK